MRGGERLKAHSAGDGFPQRREKKFNRDKAREGSLEKNAKRFGWEGVSHCELAARWERRLIMSTVGH